MEKPDVDLIEGFRRRISIEQKTTAPTRDPPSAPSPRIYDYLRLLCCQHRRAALLQLRPRDASQSLERSSTS
jgi:excinuclease UvrABC ATPase subunit